MNKLLLPLLVLIFAAGAANASHSNFNDNIAGNARVAATKTNQTITFPALPAQTFGAADLLPGATASSGLGITYTSSNTDIATIVNGKIHMLTAGRVTITATQAGNAAYNAAPAMAKLLVIGKASLVITATNKTKTYGAANPALTVTYVGFLRGNTAASLTTQPAIATTATTASIPGNYPITVSGATATNYAITFVKGTLAVSKKMLTVTASNRSKTYGTANPPLLISYSGFIAGESASNLTKQPAAITNAKTTSPAGSYPIDVTGGASGNYLFNYIYATLTVNKRDLTITADNKTRTYGAANPPLTVKYAGFLTGESASNLTVQPTVTTTATASTPVGILLPITPAGAASPNYNISYVSGSMIINKAPLTITADNKIKPLGTVNPPLTLTYSGFVNGDSATGLTPQPTVSTTASTASPVGTYPITVSGAANSNYAIAYVNGSLTVVDYSIPPVINYSSPHTYVTGKAIASLMPALTGGAIPASEYGKKTFLAGNGASGSHNGTGKAASFYMPDGIALDAAGNLYVADGGNNLIRKVTPLGVVTTYAGTGSSGSTNGDAASATFNNPADLAFDQQGNLFIADVGNRLIRKITPAGVVSTFAGSGALATTDGTGTAAAFMAPTSIAIDTTNTIYVADNGNVNSQPSGTIRKITKAGVVTTIYTGSGYIQGMATDKARNLFYLFDGNLLKRAVSGTTTTVYNGLYFGISLKVDAIGNVFVTTQGGLSKLTPGGVLSQVAGGFTDVHSLAIDPAGFVYVGDIQTNILQKVAVTGYSISRPLPSGLIFDATTGIISGIPATTIAASDYIVTAYNLGGSSSATLSIAVNASSNQPVIHYNGSQVYTKGTAITPLAPVNTGGAVPANIYAQVTTYTGKTQSGFSNGPIASATFNGPNAAAFDAAGNMYVADYYNNVIRKITPGGVVSTFAGNGTESFVDGTGTAAGLNGPADIAIDAAGNLYVADEGNSCIRKITQAGVVTTFAGNGTTGAANGTGTAATFYYPNGIGIDATGNLYVGDTFNNLIRKITPGGVVSTFAGSGTPGAVNGTGTAASFNRPFCIRSDAAGNLYVSDNNAIRKITPAGVVTTFAGSGTSGYADGAGTAASVNFEVGLAVDANGNIYVADYNNQLIRKITASGSVTTLAGIAGSWSSVNGTGTAAGLGYPIGLTISNQGDLYVVEQGNNDIRKILLTGYTIDKPLTAGLSFDAATGTISGTPTATSAATDYIITGYNAAGSGTAVVNIAVQLASMFAVNTIAETPIVADEPKVKQLLSPNGDGNNDVLMIENIAQYPDNKVMLMNRGGQKVFEIAGYDNVNKAFDGQSNINGKLQPAGTYFYILEYKDKGAVKRKTGYFVIKY